MKVGDKVRILKRFSETAELVYLEEMNDELGRIGEITDIHESYFIVDTGFEPSDYIWPKRCLELVRNSLDAVTPDEWTEASNRVMGYDKRTFPSGSVRDNDDNKPLPSELDPYVRLRFGFHMKKGALKYEKGNWRKGQPTETALESLHRHLTLYEIGDRTEDHLSAIIFNTQLIMMNEKKDGINYDYFWNSEK